MKLLFFFSLLLSLFFFLSLEKACGQQNGNFVYDHQGRPVADPVNNIERIQWNNQNRITHIERNTSSHDPDIEFVYNTYGDRILKIIKPRNGAGLLPQNQWSYTYYQHDPAHTTVGKYVRNFTEQSHYASERLIENDKDLFAGDRIGYRLSHRTVAERTYDNNTGNTSLLIPAVTSSQFTTLKGEKFFELTSHSHNVNTIVSDRFGSHHAEVVGAARYYPGGMTMSEPDAFAPRGFMQHERVDEVSGEGNVYHTYYREYDARLERWMSTDPAYHQYPAMSPYGAFGGNPVLVLDYKGDILRIHGGAAEVTKFKSILNKGLSNKVKVEVDEQGIVTLTGDAKNLNKTETAVYTALSTIINEQQKTHLKLVDEGLRLFSLVGTWNGATVDKKDERVTMRGLKTQAERAALVNHPDVKGINAVDVYDIEMIQGLSPASALIHEMWETYLTQTKQLDFDQAHEAALAVEAQVNDVKLVGLPYEGVLNRTDVVMYIWYEQAGKKKTARLLTRSNDIIHSSVLEGHINLLNDKTLNQLPK